MKKKAKQENYEMVAQLIVNDNQGPLLEQIFNMTKKGDVQVVTNVGLGGNDLALALLVTTGAHALFEGAKVPEALTEQLMEVLQQAEALIKIRGEARQQKSRDPRGYGSLDDWPSHEDDSEIPF